MKLILIAIAAAALCVSGVPAQQTTYQLIDNWAQLPGGAKWGTMSAVDIDAAGHIFAFQRSPSTVMVFDSTGALLRTWGENAFPSAHALRVDREGNVWVTDRMLHQVIKFSPDGKVLLELGKKGIAGTNESTDALNGPADVVTGVNGDIFVADGESTSTRVVKYAKDGRFIKYWGTKGTGPGELDVPHNIVMDSKGHLFVADRSNNRVQVFDQEGRYLDQLTNVGTPYGMFMTKDDVLFVVDGTTKNAMTVVNTKNKQVVDHLEGLTAPHWITVDSSGTLYIAEVAGMALKKFVKK